MSLSKKSINHESKFTLVVFCLVHIHHFFIPEGKCVIRETIDRGNVRSGKFHSRNFPPWKSLSGSCLDTKCNNSYYPK